MDNFKYKDASGAMISSSWIPNETAPVSGMTVDEAKKMREMLNDLTQAVLDFGPNKNQHMKVLVRHRTEWPFLWEKIDNIVSFIASDAKGDNDE